MSGKEVVREASHAGSWYTSSPQQLNAQLDGWLAAVKTPIHCIGPRSEGQTVPEIPAPGARIIIAPHAGYSYSGPAAAWAYKTWDISKATRIFLLGPSHHHYLTKAALSRCTHYATPLGNLTIDRTTTAELHKSGQFEWMTQSVDEDEHSLEMHLPYIFKMLSKTHGNDPSKFPLLVPIMIGNTTLATEGQLGRLLAPYLSDPSTAFVVSSDFAHWGSRFRYTVYRAPGSPSVNLSTSSAQKAVRSSFPIHASIKAIDFDCMGACESGLHLAWAESLEETENTVCGRHPIAVMMAAIEVVRKEQAGSGMSDGGFNFVRYERSAEITKVSESSVSYASAFAVI